MVTGQLRGSNTINLCELITRTFSLSTVKFDINRQISTSIDKFKLSSLKIHYCYIFFCYFTVSSKKMEIKRTVEKRRLSISLEEFESCKTPLSEEFLQLGVSRCQGIQVITVAILKQRQQLVKVS